MRQFLYIAMLLLFARVCNPCAAQQPNKPLIDTARINAMRDSAGSRIMQVFDVDMLSKCLQVKQIENIRSLSLLKLNTPLRDTIEAFRVGYGTDILVHSYINSEQFWPKVIFNPNRLTRDIGNATKSPAVGFDVSFTPYGRGSERKFAIDITNQATANLLSDAQLTTLKGVTKKGIKGQFRKLSPDGKDSVNASLFRGIATLRGYWENELSKCNIQKVTFTPIAKPNYGFDTEPNETMKNFYERLVLNGRNYNVPWKSIEAGKEEDIIARISLKDSNPATHKVNFRREKASPPIVKANVDGTYTLTLTGGSNKDEEIIEAFYTDTLPGGKTKESVVGKIKVKSYSPIKSKVIPVKLNGASFSESTVALENALNDIYKQAAVSWTVAEPISVTVDQNTWDVDEKDGILLIETSPLRRYSREMQAIIDAIKKDSKYDSEASYAIITDLPNSEGYAGYMPLKSDFAFIFTKSNGDLKKLIPHELGHGVFYLKHPQDEYHILDATDNLMDKYAVGTTLWKPQWDWIGDPSWRLYMFQEENQGASITLSNVEKLKGWEYQNIAYAFLAPSGKVLLLPKKVSSIEFSTGDKAKSKSGIDIIPFGTIISFTIKDSTFTGTWYPESKMFNNYSCNGVAYKVKDYITTEFNERLDFVIVGSPVLVDGALLFNVFKYNINLPTIDDIKKVDFAVKDKFVSFDFISKGFNGSEEVRTIAAPSSFEKNQAVINFIEYYINLNKKFEKPPFYDLYLYTHATLLDRYKLLSSCFATGLPGKFMDNYAAYKKAMQVNESVDPMILGGPTITTVSYTEIDPGAANFEILKDVSAFTHIMEQWSKVNMNYYEELSSLVSKYKDTPIPSDITDKNIKSFLSIFGDYSSSETDNFDCLFSSFSSEKKIAILELLLKTEYDDSGNDLEKVTNKIFKSLNDSEKAIIFQVLKADPIMLSNAYKKLNNALNGSYISEFMYQLLNDWQSLHPGIKLPDDLIGINIENLEKGLKTGDKAAINDLEKIIGHKSVILLEEEKIFTGHGSDITLEVEWPSINDGIKISQRKEYINNYGNILIKILSPSSALLGDANKWFSDPSKELKGLNPLDPVFIFISESEHKELQLNIKPGLYAVPAIFVLWISEAKEAEVKEFYLRIALDGVAIALAPFSGGSSVALISLEIGLPAIDVIMSTANKQISSNAETWNEIYRFWDNSYMIYGTALGTTGIIKIIPSAVSGVKSTVRFFAGRSLAKVFIKTKNFKGLTKADFINFNDELIKFADNAIASFENSWSSYATGLKELASGAKINYELRVANAFDDIEGLVKGNKYLLGYGSQTPELFTFSFADDITNLSEIRLLRNFENVSEVKYVGVLDNVSYQDGKAFSKLFLVEDAKVKNQFYCLSETDILKGKLGNANISSVRAEINLLETLENSIGARITGNALDAYNDLIKTEFNITVKGKVIQFTDQSGVSIAEISGAKFTPKSFLSGGELVGEPVDNLQLVKSKGKFGYKFSDPTIKVHNGIVDYNYFINSCNFSKDLDLAEKSFYLYREKNWVELEDLFKNNKLNVDNGIVWPPAKGGCETERVTLRVGDKLDRYQFKISQNADGTYNYSGEYTSPLDASGNPIDYEQRALFGAETDYPIQYEIKVLKEFQVEKSKAIPWHGHAGNGPQVKFDSDISQYIRDGYIEVKPVRSPNGTIKISGFATGADELTDITTVIAKSGEDFTVLTNARKLPGTALGNGKEITGTWLRGTNRNAGLFPKSVADKLRGKTFNNFDEFRQTFWKEVANDPHLSSQFDTQSLQRMQNGLAPFTDISQQLGGQKNYILHHKTPINQGGAVYDVDNLYIVTPKYHKEILDPAYHYGYGY